MAPKKLFAGETPQAFFNGVKSVVYITREAQLTLGVHLNRLLILSPEDVAVGSPLG